MDCFNKLFIILLCLCCSIVGKADDLLLEEIEIDGNIYTLNDTQKTAELTKWCQSKYLPVTIPSTVTYQDQYYTVNIVGYLALQGCTGEYLSVPPTIQLFRDAACFESKFKEVRITDLSAWCKTVFFDNDSNPCAGVPTNNDGDALLVCNGEPIYDLVVPDDVRTIPGYLFYCNSHIRSLTTTSVEVIGQMAFAGCKNFKSANLGSAIKTIGYEALGTDGIPGFVEGDAPSYINIYAPTMPAGEIAKSTRIYYSPRFESYWICDEHYSSQPFKPNEDNTDEWFANMEPHIRFVEVDGLLYRINLNKRRS